MRTHPSSSLFRADAETVRPFESIISKHLYPIARKCLGKFVVLNSVSSFSDLPWLYPGIIDVTALFRRLRMRLPRGRAVKWLAAKGFDKTCRGFATEPSAEEINATGLPLAQRCKVCLVVQIACTAACLAMHLSIIFQHFISQSHALAR